jgi:hypothetical protein
MPTKKRTPYVAVPKLLFDDGTVAAIGTTPFVVYLLLRRYQFAAPSVQYPQLNDLREKGYLVAFLDQTKAASLLGVKRQTVIAALTLLRRIGWIRRIKLPRNRRGYRLGIHGEYYAESFLSDAMSGLSRRASPAARVEHLRRSLTAQ